ncbi:MAG TPA: hypothetical protein VFU76_07840 [Terriglobales bacterium]|nr:hypothetical protein [Terriglobales bacterium]
MPLHPGRSKKTVSRNIREFHTGKTYARAAAKYGKRVANRQAVAAALSEKRRSVRKGSRK